MSPEYSGKVVGKITSLAESIALNWEIDHSPNGNLDSEPQQTLRARL